MNGPNVVEKIIYPDETHTSIDDETKLHDFMIKEIGELMNVQTQSAKPFYIGAGEQISEQQIIQLAAENGIPPYLALACSYKETPKLIGSWSSGALNALYEDHVAYRNSSGSVRNRLADARIAARGWRELPYPPSPYPHIDLCAEIAGAEIASLSTSWGLFQILGENHKRVGFETALEMVTWLAASELNQFTAWVRVIDSMGVKDDLLREDWNGYAKRYNGPKYASHGYHTKLAALAAKFAKKYGKGIPTLPAPTDPVPTIPDVVTPTVPDVISPLPVITTELTLENLRSWPPEKILAGKVAVTDFLTITNIIEQERLNPTTKAAISPPVIEETDMSFIKSKSIFKSKRIWGIAGVLITALFPVAQPIVDFVLPTITGATPEVLEQMKSNQVAAEDAIQKVLIAVNALLTLYGSLVAEHKLTLPGATKA
ncbi:MAG: hypothetical protein COA78_14905 [Blastopirellula sp.]|nr:MAG: hypothetical protein COA78_14905 [Blastopirellula sp.]